MCRQCYSPTPVAEVPLPAAPTRRGLLKGLAAGTSALALAGCVPSGLGTAFAPPPREIERLADASWARILQERRVWTNAAANQRAQRVAQRLIPLAGGPSRAWEVVLFDDASV